jgi:hypothetical protein
VHQRAGQLPDRARALLQLRVMIAPAARRRFICRGSDYSSS